MSETKEAKIQRRTSTSKILCDVCGRKNKSLEIISCCVCGVSVHKECYGVSSLEEGIGFECLACRSVGKYFQVDARLQDGSRSKLLQKARPTKCDLCSFEDTSTPHAMHPLFDNHGKKGRQIFRTDPHPRLVWAHTICCRVLETRGCLVPCLEDGSSNVHDDELENEKDDDDDRSVNPELAELQKSKDRMNIHHFQYYMQLPSQRAKEPNVWVKTIREYQEQLVCNVCKQKDVPGKTLRIPLTCFANNPDEPKEARDKHPDSFTCSTALHVGCANWGNNKNAVKRVYFWHSNGGESENQSCLYCSRHAENVDRKYQKKLNEKKAAAEIDKANDLAMQISTQEEQEEEDPTLWKYIRIVSHQGPLNPNHPAYKDSKYNVLLEWENGEITPEPLSVIATDDPVTCAIYAKDNNLLDTDGWKRFKSIELAAGSGRKSLKSTKASTNVQSRASKTAFPREKSSDILQRRVSEIPRKNSITSTARKTTSQRSTATTTKPSSNLQRRTSETAIPREKPTGIIQRRVSETTIHAQNLKKMAIPRKPQARLLSPTSGTKSIKKVNSDFLDQASAKSPLLNKAIPKKRKLVEESTSSTSKKTKLKPANMPLPPAPSLDATPVTAVARPLLGISRDNYLANKKAESNTKTTGYVDQISQDLIKDCAHIGDDAQRTSKLTSLRKKWKRQLPGLSSEDFKSTWVKAKEKLKQQMEQQQEKEVSTGGSSQPSSPKKRKVGDNTASVLTDDQVKEGVAPSKDKNSSPKRQKKDKAVNVSGEGRKKRIISSTSEVSVLDDGSNEVMLASIPERVEELQKAENQWSTLLVGVKFEGRKYTFGDWDTSSALI